MADNAPSLYLDRMRRFTSVQAHTTDHCQHTEITLQEIPKVKSSLRLFVENQERELQKESNRTWGLAQHLYVSFLPITSSF